MAFDNEKGKMYELKLSGSVWLIRQQRPQQKPHLRAELEDCFFPHVR